MVRRICRGPSSDDLVPAEPVHGEASQLVVAGNADVNVDGVDGEATSAAHAPVAAAEPFLASLAMQPMNRDGRNNLSQRRRNSAESASLQSGSSGGYVGHGLNLDESSRYFYGSPNQSNLHQSSSILPRSVEETHSNQNVNSNSSRSRFSESVLSSVRSEGGWSSGTGSCHFKSSGSEVSWNEDDHGSLPSQHQMAEAQRQLQSHQQSSSAVDRSSTINLLSQLGVDVSSQNEDWKGSNFLRSRLLRTAQQSSNLFSVAAAAPFAVANSTEVETIQNLRKNEEDYDHPKQRLSLRSSRGSVHADDDESLERVGISRPIYGYSGAYVSCSLDMEEDSGEGDDNEYISSGANAGKNARFGGGEGSERNSQMKLSSGSSISSESAPFPEEIQHESAKECDHTVSSIRELAASASSQDQPGKVDRVSETVDAGSARAKLTHQFSTFNGPRKQQMMKYNQPMEEKVYDPFDLGSATTGDSDDEADLPPRWQKYTTGRSSSSSINSSRSASSSSGSYTSASSSTDFAPPTSFIVAKAGWASGSIADSSIKSIIPLTRNNVGTLGDQQRADHVSKQSCSNSQKGIGAIGGGGVSKKKKIIECNSALDKISPEAGLMRDPFDLGSVSTNEESGRGGGKALNRDKFSSSLREKKKAYRCSGNDDTKIAEENNLATSMTESYASKDLPGEEAPARYILTAPDWAIGSIADSSIKSLTAGHHPTKRPEKLPIYQLSKISGFHCSGSERMQTKEENRKLLAASIIQRGWRIRKYCAQYLQEQEASIKIQNMWRRISERKAYILTKRSAIVLQSYTRGILLRKTYLHHTSLTTNAVFLQAFGRGFLARKGLAKKQCAAVCIQRAYRTFKTNEAITRHEQIAATMISSLARGKIARVELAQQRKAAIIIQESVRSHRSRRQHELEQAATVLQAFCRSICLSLSYRRKRSSCIVIQSIYRRARKRRDSSRARASTAGLLFVQALFRARNQRKKFEDKKKAIITIQRAWKYHIYRLEDMKQTENANYIIKTWRRYSTERKYARIKNSVVLVQKWRRGLSESVKYNVLGRGIIMLQANARGVQQRSRLRRQVGAAVVLQRAWLIYQQGKDFEGNKIQTAAIKIQSAQRTVAILREYQDIRASATVLQAFARGYSRRRQYRTHMTLIEACTKIQSLSRGANVRHILEKETAAATIVQSAYRSFCVQRQMKVGCASVTSSSLSDYFDDDLPPASCKADKSIKTLASEEKAFVEPENSLQKMPESSISDGSTNGQSFRLLAYLDPVAEGYNEIEDDESNLKETSGRSFKPNLKDQVIYSDTPSSPEESWVRSNNKTNLLKENLMQTSHIGSSNSSNASSQCRYDAGAPQSKDQEENPCSETDFPREKIREAGQSTSQQEDKLQGTRSHQRSGSMIADRAPLLTAADAPVEEGGDFFFVRHHDFNTQKPISSSANEAECDPLTANSQMKHFFNDTLVPPYSRLSDMEEGLAKDEAIFVENEAAPRRRPSKSCCDRRGRYYWTYYGLLVIFIALLGTTIGFVVDFFHVAEPQPSAGVLEKFPEPSRAPSILDNGDTLPTSVVVDDLGPSVAPVDIPDYSIYMEILAPMIEVPAMLLDITSPEFQALQWLVEDDTRSLGSGEPSFPQRFILALLYFTTQGWNWNECGGTDERSPCPTTGGRFLSRETECNWHGISCDDENRVISIKLKGMNLQGPIPADLSALEKLEQLSLQQNNLSSTIPSSFGKLANLKELDLMSNSLRGIVPIELGQARYLRRVQFSSNSLSGSLPDIFNEHMQLFDSSANQLTGELPLGLFSATSLEVVNLAANNFSGSLNAEFGNLRNARKILLWLNSFTGTIPPTFGNLEQLQTFHTTYNRLSGIMPQELCRLVEDGSLLRLSGDCGTESGRRAPRIECQCCTLCLDGYVD